MRFVSSPSPNFFHLIFIHYRKVQFGDADYVESPTAKAASCATVTRRDSFPPKAETLLRCEGLCKLQSVRKIVNNFKRSYFI